jgi:hypothetical protein
MLHLRLLHLMEKFTLPLHRDCYMGLGHTPSCVSLTVSASTRPFIRVTLHFWGGHTSLFMLGRMKIKMSLLSAGTQAVLVYPPPH